ncbi:uncharacterized protein PAC_06553 [Phialocephala subalpina]|uniref:Alternative oxidase n=1 Tax=Phialocephala subalpina TaxID=576137 RepID=A0A1L7WV58_9HELO|nr:uncharacterized protein PAC_06553 [Phialocephala subalpina]
MFSVRRISASLAHVVQSAIRDAYTWSYQPLTQDALLSSNASRKGILSLGLRSRLSKLFACTAAVLCVLAAFVYSRGDGILSNTSSLGPSRTDISKDQFIAAILREPVEGVLDPDPIRKKCDETKFQDGLVWHCAAGNGGIGNEANMWLNCVRYAIEAGATTLILPRLGARSDNLLDLGGEAKSVELSYLFDVSYFLDSWKVVCPQIRAVVSESEVPNLPSSADSPHLSPSNVKNFEMRKYLIVDPTGWREAFDAWLAKNAAVDTMSAEKPVRVYQNLVLAQWNREAHPLEFANSFPRLFRYPVQTRRLAASALWSLEKKLSCPVVADAIVLSSGSSPSSRVSSLGPHRLATNTFMGVHLRVSADAAAAGWPGYEAQAPFYIAEAKRLNLTTIYLATGSPEHRERFREDAALNGLDVIVKEDLFNEEEVAELQSLTWDQQALVDFDVLMHSSFFYGFVRSSFTWSLALRRGILPESGTSGVTKEDEYRDSLSAIVGRYDSINPEGLWP